MPQGGLVPTTEHRNLGRLQSFPSDILLKPET